MQVMGTTKTTFPIDIAEKKETRPIELQRPARMAKNKPDCFLGPHCLPRPESKVKKMMRISAVALAMVAP